MLLQSLPRSCATAETVPVFQFLAATPAYSLPFSKEHLGTLGTPKISVKTAKHELPLPATHTNTPNLLKALKEVLT